MYYRLHRPQQLPIYVKSCILNQSVQSLLAKTCQSGFEVEVSVAWPFGFQTFPRWTLPSLSNGIEECFSQWWNRGRGTLTHWWHLELNLLWSELNPAANKGMVRVKVNIVKVVCDELTVARNPPGNDEVQLVPAMGSRMFSWDILAGFSF